MPSVHPSLRAVPSSGAYGKVFRFQVAVVAARLGGKLQYAVIRIVSMLPSK